MHKILTLITVLMVVTMMSSCLTTNDGTTTYYDDVAITSFSLGTLKRDVTYKLSTGKDTTVTRSVSCSDYDFYIDNVKDIIYNRDSLLHGTRVNKSIATITAKNSGYIYIKNINSDTLTAYSSTDSLDFSEDRLIRVYANDGSWSKDYILTVNVHKDVEDSLYWADYTASTDIANMKSIKAVHYKDSLLVWGENNDGTSLVAVSKTSDPGTFYKLDYVPVNAKSSILYVQGVLLVLTDGDIYATEDLETWVPTSVQPDLLCLAAADSNYVYAISKDKKIMRSGNIGITWEEDKMSGSTDLIPTTDVSGLNFTVKTNDDMLYVLFTGLRDTTAYPNDKYAQVWMKIVDYSSPEYTQPWQNLSTETTEIRTMPALKHLQAITYGQGMMAYGAETQGSAYSYRANTLLWSEDKGITWKPNSHFFLPDGFTAEGSAFALAAAPESPVFWIVTPSKVWCGRFSTYSWLEYYVH